MEENRTKQISNNLVGTEGKEYGCFEEDEVIGVVDGYCHSGDLLSIFPKRTTEWSATWWKLN